VRLTSPLGAVRARKTPLSEDLLSSLVFGTLAHAPDQLLDWLRTSTPTLATLQQPLRLRTVEAWPWWAHDVGTAGCEPDVVIELDTDSGTLLLLVEAKLGAEKSGQGERDQLMRQSAQGLREACRRRAEFAGVLYLTADSVRPQEDLDASRRELDRQGLAGSHLGWLRWGGAFEAARAAKDRAEPMLAACLDDLLAVLAHAGLARFCGWEPVWPIRYPFWTAVPRPSPVVGFPWRDIIPAAGGVTWRFRSGPADPEPLRWSFDA